MTDQELLDFNRQGFIPGPGETEGRFLERVGAVNNEQAGSLPRAHLEWTKHHVQGLFDFEPHSLAAFYSNKNLTPWQGAACWISEDGVPLLQLREGFRKGSYLGLYSREEILAHEAIHAARAGFAEHRFEEFFAYASSEKKWRKVLGPIIQRPYEAWVFLICVLMGLLWEGCFALGAIWMGLGFYRLAKNHYRLSKAFNILMGQLKQEKKARSVLFRLTDFEIQQLAKGIWIEGDNSLRWRLIRLAYF